MTPHDLIRPLLALSAAGLLDATDERSVREHVRDCAGCAAELDSFGALAEGLGSLPVPAPLPGLVARTEARLAADRDKREAQRLSIAAAACAGTLGIAACFQLEPYLGPAVWFAATAIPTLLGAGAAAVLTSHRRLQRRPL
jgi:hypothetical protein